MEKTSTKTAKSNSLLTIKQFFDVIENETAETSLLEVLEWAYELNPELFTDTSYPCTLKKLYIRMKHTSVMSNDVLSKNNILAHPDATEIFMRFIKAKDININKWALYRRQDVTLLNLICRTIYTKRDVDALQCFLRVFNNVQWDDNDIKCLFNAGNEYTKDIIKRLFYKGIITHYHIACFNKCDDPRYIAALGQYPEFIHNPLIIRYNHREFHNPATYIHLYIDSEFPYEQKSLKRTILQFAFKYEPNADLNCAIDRIIDVYGVADFQEIERLMIGMVYNNQYVNVNLYYYLTHKKVEENANYLDEWIVTLERHLKVN